MSYAFATLQDVTSLWRPLTAQEQERVTALLPMVSDLLRQAATNAGADLDKMLVQNPPLQSTAKMVTVDVVSRILRQSTTGEPVSQETQSALGYSWQGTYAIPGGGMANAIMNNDLKRLGIRKQKIKAVELYDRRRACDPACQNANGD